MLTNKPCNMEQDWQCILHIYLNKPNIKYHKYPSMGAELFHADGQTDRGEEASGGFS
jgi:hypothetical protein